MTLLHFRAEGKPEGVRLSWATATELNNARFEIQRSLDGREFATVATQLGQGTSTTSRAYTWLDAAPPKGTVYYRLRQIDTNGSSQWSGVAVIQERAIATFYPNPVQEELTIQAAAGLQYRVLSPLGQVVLRGQTAPSTTRLDVRQLKPGVYYLQLEGAGNVEGVTFYKQ
ncbi:T9SS type A sorting domain-containing protein [Hymenobacter sediminis]|uniref:T9SS type A sorting domain-containing protein n=1 Tax=Hymenobacter sediminis TaxID=2218621 RepID=UPI00138FE067|nr:T9SS type A sorting domain-containing protein [Hymenobacter sediminis]